MKPLVHLVRHGTAEDDHPLGDEARALTEEGRMAFRSHARELAARMQLVGVATSPLVRAVQTAEILADACGVLQVVSRGELSIDGGSARAIEALALELGPGWALVGHNPSMAETLARMLRLAGEPRFRKGAVAAVEMGGPSGSVHWSLAWMAAPGKKVQTEL